jgi:hypothetical protein
MGRAIGRSAGTGRPIAHAKHRRGTTAGCSSFFFGQPSRHDAHDARDQQVEHALQNPPRAARWRRKADAASLDGPRFMRSGLPCPLARPSGWPAEFRDIAAGPPRPRRKVASQKLAPCVSAAVGQPGFACSLSSPAFAGSHGRLCPRKVRRADSRATCASGNGRGDPCGPAGRCAPRSPRGRR